MEEYSAPLEAWVKRQLQNADARTFQQLLAYYRQRGGPGLVLAEAELAAGTSPVATSTT